MARSSPPDAGVEPHAPERAVRRERVDERGGLVRHVPPSRTPRWACFCASARQERAPASVGNERATFLPSTLDQTTARYDGVQRQRPPVSAEQLRRWRTSIPS